MTKEMNPERAFEKAEELEDRYTRRKAVYLNKIMGELEAFVESPGEEWKDEQDMMLADMQDAINNSVKAQLSSNNPEYTG